MITLLRYNNRKIYSKEVGGYISSDEVLSYIIEGTRVQVISNKSGDDITHVTLVAMGVSQMRQGNVEGGRLLIRYADAYRPTLSLTGGV